MPNSNPSDPFDLARFLSVQDRVYDQALAEIQNGRKLSHWMWYIFPQYDGLAFSSTSKFYAIKSIKEARAYLDHPVLDMRLKEISEAALRVKDRTANQIFGTPDDLKLKSSATLFDAISLPGSVFDRLLAHFFDGGKDERTLELLSQK